MSEWREVTLGELCDENGGSVQTGPFGSQLHASSYVNDGVPCVMPQDIGDNLISTDKIARVSSDDRNRLARYALETGDIVFSRRGDVGRRALVHPGSDGWLCGTGCLRIRLGMSLGDAQFISYALGTVETRGWILRHSVGATMANLNTSILRSTPLSVPGERSRLAIGGLLGALDDKIAANAELARTADRLACGLFTRSVAGVESGPRSFGDLCAVGGGGTPKSSEPAFWSGDTDWATPTDVTRLSGPYLRSTAKRITSEGLAACASRLYPVNSILMTSRATIGSFALAKAPMAVNQGFIVVNPTDKSLRCWFLHEMRSRVDEFKSLANGATFLELSRGNFKKLPVRLADPAAMTEFCARAGGLHDLANQALIESDALARLRDTLLPHLMSGRMRVRDAEKTVSDAV